MQDKRANANATASAEPEPSDRDLAIRELTANPEKAARIKLLIARTSKIEMERSLLAGEYVKREDLKRDQVAKVLAVKTKLVEFPRRAALIANRSVVEVEAVLTEWMQEACAAFAGTEAE